MTAAMLTSLLSALNIFRGLDGGCVPGTFCETNNNILQITNKTVPIWHNLFCSSQSVSYFFLFFFVGIAKMIAL